MMSISFQNRMSALSPMMTMQQEKHDHELQNRQMKEMRKEGQQELQKLQK